MRNLRLRLVRCGAAVGLLAGVAVVLPTVSDAAPPPSASFVRSPVTPYPNEPVQFTSTSTGDIDSTSWDLDGDGAYDDATGLAAQTSFADPGPHQVGVSIKTPSGPAHHRTTVTVIPLPASNFLHFPDVPAAGQTVSLTAKPLGVITDYEWDLDGDGKYNDARGASASTEFPTAGPHKVGLRVTDVRRTVDTSSAVITATAVANPTAALQLKGGAPAAGKPVTLDASGSAAPPDASIISYRWDFRGNGKYHTTTGTDPIAHFIFRGGSHTLQVKVEDSNHHFDVETITIHPTPPQGACDSGVSIGLFNAIASCVRHHGSVYDLTPGHTAGVIGDELNIDGLTFRTNALHNLMHIDTDARRIWSDGPYQLLLENTPIGDIFLWGANDHIDFTAGSGHGTSDGLTRLATIGAGAGCDPTQPRTSCATLPGNFPLQGLLDLSIDTSNDDIVIGANVEVHDAITVTGRVRIRADLFDGIYLDQLGFGVENADFGPFVLDHLNFEYETPGTGDPRHDGDLWRVSAAVTVSGFHAEAVLEFVDGQFHYGSADVTLPSGVGIPIYAGVLLNRFFGEFGVHPVRIGAGIGVSVVSVLQINGNFHYTDFGGGHWQVRVDGVALFQRQPIANGYYTYDSNGYYAFGAGVQFQYPYPSGSPRFRIAGNIAAWIEAEPDGTALWQATGDVNFQIGSFGPLGVTAQVNANWASACMHIGPLGVSGAYNFHTSDTATGLGCDLSAWAVTPLHTAPARYDSTGRRLPSVRKFTVAAGLDAVSLEVDGSGGTPDVTLTDPAGAHFRVPTGATVFKQKGRFTGVGDPVDNRVLVRIENPRPGTYRLVPTAGSPAVHDVSSAEALPAVQISTNVTGSGHSRTLHWTAHHLAGRTLRLVERADKVTQLLAITKQAKGSVPFAPAAGAGGSRRIEADVFDGSLPLKVRTVGHYLAPGNVRPGRPGAVHFTRQGLVTTVSWGRAAHASGYVVHIAGSDGRHELRVTRHGVHTIRIKDLQPSAGVRVSVRGWRHDPKFTGVARRARLRHG